MISRTRHSRYLGWDGDRTWTELKYIESAWPEIDILPLWEGKTRFWRCQERLLCEHYPVGMDKGEKPS